MTHGWWYGLIALVGWVGFGFFFGMYLGERGRRASTERREVTGSPLGATAARLPDLPDTESRLLSLGRDQVAAGFSEATVNRGIEQLQREAKAMGRHLSAEEARSQALTMLAGGFNEAPGLLDG